MVRSCVVIACWGGERRLDGCSPQQMLLNWCVALSKLPHDLDRVIFVSNESDRETEDYRCLLVAVSLLNFGCPVEVLRRENVNGSYGAWKYAWERHQTDFDWYIVFEDDYQPTLNNWDRKLIALAIERGADYLGGAMGAPTYEKHMGAASGALRERALAASKVNQRDLHIYNPELQISFSRDMLEAGLVIADYQDKWCVPYRNQAGGVDLHGNCENPAIIAPMEWTR